jgi:hypothetical protein
MKNRGLLSLVECNLAPRFAGGLSCWSHGARHGGSSLLARICHGPDSSFTVAGSFREAYQVPHLAYEAEDRNMSRFRAGTELPTNVKRAAPNGAGVQWHFYGVPVANP